MTKSSGHPATPKVGWFAYWIAVAAIFNWAAWLRFRLPLNPIAEIDTWGYLSPAINKLSGLGFTHSLRNYFYPGFLYLILRAFGDFRAIIVVQHLLGLAAGCILLATWRRIQDFTPKPGLSHGLQSVAGLGLAFTYLSAPEPIRFETDLRPEGVISFLVAINIFFIVEFWYRCFIRPKPDLPIMLGALSVLSSIAVGLTKPSFAIAACGALLPVITALLCNFSWRRKLALIAVSASAGIAMILPAQLAARADAGNQEFLPTQLFVIHADIICDQMAKDIQNDTSGPYQRDWLRKIQQLLAAELTEARHTGHRWRALGFDANYLMYNSTSIVAKLREEFGGNRKQIREFYWYYYARAWFGQPGRMAAKVAREMLVFYSRISPVYFTQKHRLVSEEYRGSLVSIQEAHLGRVWSDFRPFRQLLEQTASLASDELVLNIPRFVRRWHWFLAITYVPATLMAGIGVVATSTRQKLRRRFGALSGLMLLVWWYNFGANLEVAIVHSLDDPRYKTVQLISTVLAQFVMFLLIGNLLSQGLSRWPRAWHPIRSA